MSDLGRLDIAGMTQDDAEQIVAWRYEPPYDFYDLSSDAGDLAEILDASRRAGRYFAVTDETGALIGFLQFDRDGDAVVVGLGLRPDLTGRGLGRSLLEAGLSSARERFAPRRFRLSVATFNTRAVAVYERAGFVTTRTFDHETNGGVFSFVEMECPA